MNEQMARLYEAARELKGISGQSELARELNASPQTINNWESRGVSKQGMLTAQRVIGCSAVWIETGKGTMGIADARRQYHVAATPPNETIAYIISAAISQHLSELIQGSVEVDVIAQKAAQKLTTIGALKGALAARQICATDEECELLEIFRRTNPSGQKSIMNAARGIQVGEPIANNVESFPVGRAQKAV